ncbi:hypothetical protein TNCV_4959561 [Trichonephila clavipes]|uniref:Reverse transcriptase domain-containing protein n=1 Tax=Trichonephila clavipes TaxID=2585209 RepID=A0A8X6SHT7_TRICX|nr:hypothetical protein TNCV_4959561 [Trichonephila clavipes]
MGISCPILEFWVGKDFYTYVTCHGKLANYQDSGNRPIAVPIHKPNKNAGLTTSYRPISLTYITCKLMKSMVLRRLTHRLHTSNLLFVKGLKNMLHDMLKSFAQIGLFADDVVLWCSDVNISKMESQNRPLVNIQEFSDNHKITFNASKSTSHSEIPSLHRAKMNLTWQNPPAHHWYAAKIPGLFLQCRSSRALQTTLIFLLIFWTAGAFPWDSCLRSRPGVRHYYAEKSNGLGVGFPAPRGFGTTTKTTHSLQEVLDLKTSNFVDMLRWLEIFLRKNEAKHKI